MTDQLPQNDHDDDEMVTWVRRAYLETAGPSQGAVDAAQAAARAAVVQQGERAVDAVTTDDPVLMGGGISHAGMAKGPHALGQRARMPWMAWRRIGAVGATLLAAGVVVAVWIGERGVPRLQPERGDSAMTTMAASTSARQSPTRQSITQALSATGAQNVVPPAKAGPGSDMLGVAHGVSSALSGGARVASGEHGGYRGLVMTPGARIGSPTTAPRMDSVLARGKVAPSTFASVAPAPIPAPVPSMVSPSHSAAAASGSSLVDGLDAESAVLVQRIVDSASARGLPVTLLASRVREGVKRGVPGARIVVVTRRLASALGDAKATLGASEVPVSDLEVEAGAEALLAGAPVAALRQIRAARPAGAVTEPLLALMDLTAHGVAPLQASTALAVLAAHDRSDAGIQALRAHVVSDILRGRSPDAALADRMRQVGPAHSTVNPSPNAGVNPPATSPQTSPLHGGGGVADSLSQQPGTP